MTTAPPGVERRAAQRFALSLPVSIRRPNSPAEECGCTYDLSARGTYFYTTCALETGMEVEVTFLMPAEITLSQSMRVRCRGKVLRLDSSRESSASPHNPGAPKIGVAVHFEHYEYLPNTESRQSAQYERVGALHTQEEKESFC